MKKKICYMAIVIMASLVTVLQLNVSPSTHGLTLENIEALARGEGGNDKECFWDYEYVGGKDPIRTCSSSGWCIGYEGFKATSTRKGTCIN